MMTENKHASLGLSDDDVLEMYKTMLLARKIDERMWLLNRAGKIPFVVSCQGQEAAQVGAAFALDRTKDYVAPYYRDLGIVLTLWNDSERNYVIWICESGRSEFRRSTNAWSFRQ